MIFNLVNQILQMNNHILYLTVNEAISINRLNLFQIIAFL